MKKTALLLAMLLTFTCLPNFAFLRTVGETEQAERLTVIAQMPENREFDETLR